MKSRSTSSKRSHIDLGRRGEQLAVDYLLRKGYRILSRNFHTRRGEIDIVAQQSDQIVFVEVKTARGKAYGSPRDWVDSRKQSRLIYAAIVYLAMKQIQETDCRFDVITIELDLPKPRLTHIINAFTA
jgi:putative endonuclease